MLIDNATAFWRLGDSISSNKLVDALGRGNDLTPYLRPAPVTLDFRMGSNNTPTQQHAQQLYGSLAKWGKWNRLLTDPEKSALKGGEAWPFDVTTSLRGAVVYFLLNEASGSSAYADATGRGNTLTSRGATVQTSGPLGTDKATQFTTGVSLSRSCTADLQTGNYAWTICGWVNVQINQTGLLPQQIFWGQWDISVTTSGTNAYYVSGTNLYYEPDGGTFALDGGCPQQLAQNPAITNITLKPVLIPKWYFVLAEYDPSSNTLSHTINNDSTKRVSLSPIQQPTPVPGKIGNGSKFQLNPQLEFGTRSGWDFPPTVDGSCHAYLQRNSDVSFGNNPFTVWGWFKSANPQPWLPQTLLGLFDPTTGECEWIVQIRDNFLYWSIGNGGIDITSNNIVAVPNDMNWHLFVCWYDKAANKLWAVVDNCMPASVPLTVTPGTLLGNRRFTVGAASRSAGFNGQQFQGALNAIGIARGNPTTGPGGDLDMLWNGGKGIVLGNSRRRRATDTGPYA